MDPAPEGWRSIDTAPPQVSDEPPVRPVRAAATLAAAAIGLFVLAAVLIATSPGGTPADAGGPSGGDAPSTARAVPAATASWLVDVAGAVARPGVYALPPGSRVADAIRAAGGYSGRVDTSAADAALNLAEVLRDGAKILVPERGEASGRSTGGASGAGSASGAGGAARIDLNRATASELDTLPGIGPVTAAKIIAARGQQPFRSVDELLQRKVVSASVLEKIRALVTVGGG